MLDLAVVAPDSPTTGTDICLARAINGTTVMPPISVMNSRRLIASTSFTNVTIVSDYNQTFDKGFGHTLQSGHYSLA